MKKEKKHQSLAIYKDKRGNIEFRADIGKETLWATLNQIADLFGVQKAAISKHFKNIFDSGELSPKATVSKMETVQREGGRFIKRAIEYYNLDMVIAIGYRVNSRHATRFRMWATRVLRDHIIKGYTVNERRLKQDYELKIKELEKSIFLLQSALERCEK